MNNFDHKPQLNNLRDCQKEAYNAIIEHFQGENPEKHILIQLPTGTGKSAVIAITPFQVAEQKVLVLVPGLTLARQMKTDTDYVHHPDTNVYTKRELFDKNTLQSEEFDVNVLVLDKQASRADIEEHNIIIANYQQLNDIKKWFQTNQDVIDLIIIDEAHHQAAKTYQNVISFFPNANVIGFTATPFRTDGKKVDGKNIYTYTFKKAIQKGHIRHPKASYVMPKEIEVSFNDKNGKIYSLEDILQMKEDAWFRNNVALSQDCCDSIARMAFEKMKYLRNTYPKTSHQIIASAISIRHARIQVMQSFEKLGLRCEYVHSKQERGVNDQVLKKLKQEKIDVIINVGMLGEGFDHNKLGVAAIFRPYKTLNPYMQFIGRVIRKNDEVTDCFIVSHFGLNQSQRFKEFRLFDSGDVAFLKDLMDSDQDPVDKKVPTGEESFLGVDDQVEDSNNIQDTPMNIKERGEKVSLDDNFISNNGNNKVEDKVRELAGLGFSPEEQKRFLESLSDTWDIDIVQRMKTSPQDKRLAAKDLLHQEAKSITTDILKKFGGYTQKKYKKTSRQVNTKINKCLGIKSKDRNNLTYAQIQDFLDSGELDNIKKEVEESFKKKG